MGVEAVAGMAGAVEAADFTVGAVVVGMAEAVDTMDLLPMVAWRTWVMGGVVTAFQLTACIHTYLLVTA
jgi:hypothetical protein